MGNPATGAYPTPIQAPTSAFPFVEQPRVSMSSPLDGSPSPQLNGGLTLTQLGMNVLNQIWASLNGANVIIPCSVDQTSVNVIALTPLVTSPVPMQNKDQVPKYTVFSTWAFCATATSTGLLTGSVDPLGAIKIYKNNGGTQATTGDIVINRQYFLTYVDSLDSNAGGLVLR